MRKCMTELECTQRVRTRRIAVVSQMCVRHGVIEKCTYWPCECDHNLWLHPKTTTFLGYPKVIPYTKFEHFGIIRFWVMLCTNRQTDKQTNKLSQTYYRRRPTLSAWVMTVFSVKRQIISELSDRHEKPQPPFRSVVPFRNCWSGRRRTRESRHRADVSPFERRYWCS